MSTSSSEELCDRSAVDLVDAIGAGQVSSCEVMEAHLERILRSNPAVNAIVTVVADGALEAAAAADRRRIRGDTLGPLHGLPVAHKDLALTRGVRTTFGSPVFSDNVPDRDSLIVERLRAAGAIMLGKTNTPEFGAGSQTFNAVFGATRNPYDLGKTCGGSSGGAAVALACGLVPIADGSDLGGSLRNPAAFCNVVGLRPSPGRVPTWPSETAWCPLPVEGPMARTVADCALMLSAMAGPDPRSPIALDTPGERFRAPLGRSFRGVRVAFSSDWGGELPVEPAIVQVLDAARPVFADLGCVLDDALPDFAGADEAFRLWRAWLFELLCGPLLPQHRQQLKDTVIWNAEAGARITGPQLARAEQKRTALFYRMGEFFQRREFLVIPVTQVPPFDVDCPYPSVIDGVAMGDYLEWMKSCYYITVTGHPAIAVPCGFTDTGLPVGVQIVGRHRDDFGVLQLAYAFEQATRHYRHRPGLLKDARSSASP